MDLVFQEFVPGGKEVVDSGRSLFRGSLFAESLRVEGVVAVLDHEGGLTGGCGLDSEVTEHGVRLPATQELDDVWVYVGTEQGGGATRSEGARGYEAGRDASSMLKCESSMPEGISNVDALDGVPGPMVSVRVEMAEEWLVRRCIVFA